jgi:two-component system LytT family response regulator
MTATALIVDDEPLARRKLRDLLAEFPDGELLGEASDGAEAVRAIDELEPELVFLDIQMPLVSGLEVLERTRHKPAVIFTTAHDRFAVAAFELAAVDYLLKPFGRERFRVALERARAVLGQESALVPSVERARRALAGRGPLTRLFVRDRGKIIPIPVAEIARFESQDDYTLVHAGARTYLVHVRLSELEQRLDPERFLRIHRSHAINLDFVRSLEPHDATRLEVEMRDGTRIVASRTRSRELRGLIH